MSLRDPCRADRTFNIDETVRRLLVAWGQERDSDIGRLNLARGYQRLPPEQQAELRARLAEISLGLLFVLGERKHPSEQPSREELDR